MSDDSRDGPHDWRDVARPDHDITPAESSEKVHVDDPEPARSAQTHSTARQVSFDEENPDSITRSVSSATREERSVTTLKVTPASKSRESADVSEARASKLDVPLWESDVNPEKLSPSDVSSEAECDDAAGKLRVASATGIASRVTSYGTPRLETLATSTRECSKQKFTEEMQILDDESTTNYKKKYERQMDAKRQLVDELRTYKLLHSVKVASSAELKQILSEDPEVELDRFGTDDFKTLDELYQEVATHRCVLERTPKKIRRVVEIVVVRICYRDLVLVETHEQLPDGQVRSRNTLPGTKMILGETADDAVERFLLSELGLYMDNLSGKLQHIYSEFEKDVTLSYPLCCFFRKHDLSYNILHESMNTTQLARIGLPTGTQFTTNENKKIRLKLSKVELERACSAESLRSQQNITTHFWTWYKASIVEAINYTEASDRRGKAKDFDLTSMLNDVFGAQKYRNAYQNLLLQMFGTRFELQKLAGGFSGSMVLRAQPYDLDLNTVEPCIVKLDTAAKVREEFANSCNVYDVLADRAAKVLDEPIFVTCENTGDSFGAFKLELAGACWQVPEFTNCRTCLLSTFKDVFLYDTIQMLLPKSYLASETPPFGSAQLIINEVLGPGGMLRSLRQREIARSEDHIFSHYDLKGKDTQYNPFYSESGYNNHAREAMSEFYHKHLGEPLGDIRKKVHTLNERMKKLPSAKEAPQSPYAQMRPLIGLCHGDLNAANILVDAMDAVWLIDFATSRDLPIFSDHCKLETCLFFEYTTIPVTPATLLEFAGGEKSNEDDWFRLNVCDWLGVPREVSNALLHELQKRCQNFRKTDSAKATAEVPDAIFCKSESDLENMLKHVAGVATGKQQTNAFRQLRSRLCADESRMVAGIGAARTYLDKLVQFGGADSMSVARIEEPGGLFYKHKKEPGTTSVAFTAQVINRCRRYFVLDRQLTLHKANQKMDLAPIDGSAMLLVFPLLWETFRVLGYADCTPWFKLLGAYYCDALVNTINAVIDKAGSESTPLVPSVEEFSDSLKRLQSNHSPRSGNLANNLNDCEDDVRTTQNIYHAALKYKSCLRANTHALAIDRALRKKVRTEHAALDPKYRLSGSYCVPLAVDVEDGSGSKRDYYVAKMTLIPANEMKIHAPEWPGKVFVNDNVVGFVRPDSDNPQQYEFLLSTICYCDAMSVLSFYSQDYGETDHSPHPRRSIAERTFKRSGGSLGQPYGGMVLIMRIMWPAHRIIAQMHSSAPVLCRNIGDRVRTRLRKDGATTSSSKSSTSLSLSPHPSEYFCSATVESFLPKESLYSVRLDDTQVFYDGSVEQYKDNILTHDPSHWNVTNGIGVAHYQYPPNTELMLYLKNEGWVDARVESRLPEHGNRHCVEILHKSDNASTSGPSIFVTPPEKKRNLGRAVSTKHRSKTPLGLPRTTLPKTKAEKPLSHSGISASSFPSRSISNTSTASDSNRHGVLPILAHVDLNEFNHCVSGHFNVQHYDEEAQRMRTFMKSRHGFIIDAISQEKLDVMNDCAPARLFEASYKLVDGSHASLCNTDIFSESLQTPKKRTSDGPKLPQDLSRTLSEEVRQSELVPPTPSNGIDGRDKKNASRRRSCVSGGTPDVFVGASMSKTSASSKLNAVPEENRVLFLEKHIRSTNKRQLGLCRPRSFIVVGPRESGKTCFMKRLSVSTLSCQTDIIPLFISVTSFSSLLVGKSATVDKSDSMSPQTNGGPPHDRSRTHARDGLDNVAHARRPSSVDVYKEAGGHQQKQERKEVTTTPSQHIAEDEPSGDPKRMRLGTGESQCTSSSEFFISKQTTTLGSFIQNRQVSNGVSQFCSHAASKSTSQARITDVDNQSISFDGTVNWNEHQTASHAMEMVDQYFRHLYGEESTRYTLIYNAINSHRALFLFDCDEGKKLDPLVESCFISLAALFHPVVICCRPEVVMGTSLVRMTHLFHLYELQFLDQVQQRAIILARLGHKNTLKFRAFLDRFHDQLGDDGAGEDAVLLRLPTMLSMLLCYWLRENQKRCSEEDKASSRNRRISQDQHNVSISEVFRVATDVLVNRVQQKQQAERHKFKSRQRHFHQVLQRIAFQLQTEHRQVFADVEPADWLPRHLLNAWTDLRSAINAGQIALVMAHNIDGRLQMRFAFYSYQKYLAACCILDDDFGDEHFQFTLTDIISDPWWSEVMDMLVEKSPSRYQKLFVHLLTIDGAAKDMSETYVHMAARCEHTPLFRVLKDMPEEVKKLVEKPDAASWTPLHFAADNGNALICSLLIQNKADVTHTTRNGWTPLFYAVAKHRPEARTVLLEALRARTPHERKRSYSKLIQYGLALGEQILLPREEMSDEKLIRKLERRFPELNYFRGRSDTTPDASAHCVKLSAAEIEYRRTLVAMLSVCWICSNQHDKFIRSQHEYPITPASWESIQKLCRETVKLDTPAAVDAMLSFMAIHDLGKLSDFRGDLAPGIHDHDVAISRVVDEFPELLPSYMSLDYKYQELVASSVKVKFNFGQFLQAENLPANLIPMKELLGKQGPGALSFYLFHTFADICGIMGAQTRNGAKFMTEITYNNFRLGADVLQQLSFLSPNEVYDAFLQKRAERQGLEINNRVDRAIARLACCSRCFDDEGGALVKREFLQLPTAERERLTAYLNADGIAERPAFLLYYAPAFLENAIKNEKLGLRRALLLMLKVYDLAARSYPYTLTPVISIHIGDLASWSSTCTSARMFDHTFIQIACGTEHTESKIYISPWCQCGQPDDSEKQATSVKAYLRSMLGIAPAQRFSDELCRLPELYPELTYFGIPPLLSLTDVPPADGMSKVARSFYRLLNSIFSTFWVFSGKYEQLSQHHMLTNAKRTVLSESVFLSLQKWMLKGAKTGHTQPADFVAFVDAAITFLILVTLPKIDAFRQDFAPSKDPDACEDGAILANALAAEGAFFPSLDRLPDKYKDWIRSSADIGFDFIQFIHAQNVPANLKPLRDRLKDEDEVNFTLFHFCIKSLGYSFFDDVITSSALSGLEILAGLKKRCVTKTYELYLHARGAKLGMPLPDTSDRTAMLRIACFARMVSSTVQPQEEQSVLAATNDKESVNDLPFSVQLTAAMKALQPTERVRLVEFMSRDGIGLSRPAFLLDGISQLFENALANPVIGLTRAVRLCLNLYETAAIEYEHSKETVVTICCKELAHFVQSNMSTVSIDDVRLDMYRSPGVRGERECYVSARPWVPVKNPEVLSQLKVDGIAFAKSILNGTVSEAQFLAQVKCIFPELNYFCGKTDSTPDASASVQTLPDAEIEYRRTLGAMLSVYWVLTDQHSRFVRGQNPDDQLTKQSWENVRCWTKKNVNLTTASAVDAMLCFIALHDLGKMTHFRQDLAPGFHSHDQALSYILTNHPYVLPSFQRLDVDDQKLIRASLNVKFNLGQFLQAENLPANLIAVKDLGKTSENALGFYLFYIFADMSGILGAKTLEGSVFMTETMYANFKRGLDVLQTLSSNSVDESYNVFLQQRSILCFSAFNSAEQRALARLACCARVFDETGGLQVQDAFMSLFTDERQRLTYFLNSDGVMQCPGFLLQYAPAFLEYCRNTRTVGLTRGMRMLLQIYEAAAAEYVNTEQSIVTIFVDKFAREVKDCQCVDVFDNVVVTITRLPGEDGNMKGHAQINHRDTELKITSVRQALRDRIPFRFIYHDVLERTSGEKVDHTDFFATHKQLTGIHCTTSCYRLWEKNGKTNRFGKTIPCVQDRDLNYNVFYFDDGLQLDGGGPNDPGMCNLRFVDGTFVDFSLHGPHNFSRQQFAKNTTIQYSRNLPIVLVKVCILDALQDENYFINIVNRFSKPSEELIIHTGVHGTLVLGHIKSSKNAENTILSTLFNCLTVVASEDCDITWCGHATHISRGSNVLLTHILKKIVPTNTYQHFWNDTAPWDFLRDVESIEGLSLYFQGGHLSVDGLRQIHETYVKQLQLTKQGICRSWLELVRAYRERCLIMLNTFGEDFKKVLSATLRDAGGSVRTDDTAVVVINSNEWAEDDRAHMRGLLADAPEAPFASTYCLDDTGPNRVSSSCSESASSPQHKQSDLSLLGENWSPRQRM